MPSFTCLGGCSGVRGVQSSPLIVSRKVSTTVNSEIFARNLFSRNHEAKILAKWRNHSVVY